MDPHQGGVVGVPPDPQSQGLVGTLHQADGLHTRAAERNGVDAHHLIASLEADGRRRTSLLHLETPEKRLINLV